MTATEPAGRGLPRLVTVPRLIPIRCLGNENRHKELRFRESAAELEEAFEEKFADKSGVSLARRFRLGDLPRRIRMTAMLIRALPSMLICRRRDNRHAARDNVPELQHAAHSIAGNIIMKLPQGSQIFRELQDGLCVAALPACGPGIKLCAG